MTSATLPLRRDSARELRWLERAELDAGRSGFARHASQRLTAGEHAYGDRWTTLGLDRLLRELLEEAADLGAWGVLALQTLERVPGAIDAERIAARLTAAIRQGAQAHYELASASRGLHYELACANRELRTTPRASRQEHEA